jgi:hypothetical protein
MARARNDIRLSKIKRPIEENDDTVANVTSISLPTMAHLLKRHQISMKHIYPMPFEKTVIYCNLQYCSILLSVLLRAI